MSRSFGAAELIDCSREQDILKSKLKLRVAGVAVQWCFSIASVSRSGDAGLWVVGRGERLYQEWSGVNVFGALLCLKSTEGMSARNLRT